MTILVGLNQVLKALVLMPNEKTADIGSLLAIARDAARRRENIQINPPIRALRYVAELSVFIAVYEVAETKGGNAK